MSDKEALKLALEALEEAHYKMEHYQDEKKREQAITAIKQALAAPVQKRPPNCGTGYCSCVECVMEPTPVQADAWPCVIAEADFEQNTVTLEMQCSDYKVGAGQHWLHTTPFAQRKSLDAGEVSRIWKQHTDPDGSHHNPYDDDGLAFARAIEATHNIKENT
jgi:hypothetical protein